MSVIPIVHQITMAVYTVTSHYLGYCEAMVRGSPSMAYRTISLYLETDNASDGISNLLMAV
jgi:hypothetical protein